MNILQLNVQERETDIYIVCLFTVSTNSFMFENFRRESLEYRKSIQVLVEPEDYALYLFQRDEYMAHRRQNSPMSALLDKSKELVEVNYNRLLTYNTKRNTFRYREHVDRSYVVTGAIADLQDLKNGKNNSSVSDEQFLLSLLKTLDLHWN